MSTQLCKHILINLWLLTSTESRRVVERRVQFVRLVITDWWIKFDKLVKLSHRFLKYWFNFHSSFQKVDSELTSSWDIYLRDTFVTQTRELYCFTGFFTRNTWFLKSEKKSLRVRFYAYEKSSKSHLIYTFIEL